MESASPPDLMSASGTFGVEEGILTKLRKWTARGFTTVIGLYAVLHFLSLIDDSGTSRAILSLLGFLAVVFGFFCLQRNQLFVPIFLIAFSLTIDLVSGHLTPRVTADGLLQMQSLIALLVIIPMIGWVLREEPYFDKMMYLARNLFRTSRRFYVGMMLATQLIAYFLLFGSLPVVYQFEDVFLKGKTGETWEYFKGTALLRAFALCTLWVVSIPSFVYVVDTMDASLWLSILQGFFISLCGIALAVFMMSLREKHVGVNLTKGLQEEIGKLASQSGPGEHAGRVVGEFAVLFVTLFGTIFLIHGITGGELLIVIPLVIVAWTFCYYLVKGKMAGFAGRIKKYFNEEAPGNAQQFLILLSAGLVISSLHESGWAEAIMNGIFYAGDVIPFLNVLWLLPFVLIFLGLIGLGPLTVMVLVGGILQSVSLPYPPELVVLSLTCGSVIAILLSPFVLSVIVLSGTNGLSVFKNGMKFNLIYAGVFYLLVQTYLQLVVVLFL